jgi:hypothetical protein
MLRGGLATFTQLLYDLCQLLLETGPCLYHPPANLISTHWFPSQEIFRLSPCIINNIY